MHRACRGVATALPPEQVRRGKREVGGREGETERGDELLPTIVPDAQNKAPSWPQSVAT